MVHLEASSWKGLYFNLLIMFQCFAIFLHRYNEGLKTFEYKDIKPELARQIIDRIEKEKNASFASESWFDISAKNSAMYTGCQGNQYLTWKEKGYITVFDYITVSLRTLFF